VEISEGKFRFTSPAMRQAYALFGRWLNATVLIVTGDIPLLTPEAVEDFILRCEPWTQDFYFGVSRDEDLRAYYPTAECSGIIRPYVHLREARVRIANITLGTPKRVGEAFLVKQGYDLRKLIPWANIIRLARVMMRLRGRFKALSYLAVLQAAAVAARNGLHGLALYLSRACPMHNIERNLSHLLRTDFRLVITPFGGAAIDVDTEEDYRILEENFDRWMALQPRCAAAIGMEPITRPAAADASMLPEAIEATGAPCKAEPQPPLDV